ncbi:membrane protein [Actinomadura yumaensis]
MTEASKVATVTLLFWVMKICATTVGETGGDLLSMTMQIGYAASSLILIAFFLVTLAIQLRARAFHPFLYWAVILSTSTAETTISDFMDRSLGLGYATGATIIAMVLIAVLATWRFTQGSIAVEHIRNPKVETFYWVAILVSNTLGTALGDFLADSSGLGYAMSNLLIAGGIGLTVLAYFFTPISRTLLFWMAFVLTRPFGATMGDLLTKTPDKGGLGFGTVGSTAVLLGLLVVLIGVTSWSAQRNARRASTAPPLHS